MNYKKVLPAVALTLGMSAQIAAQAELFQMTEVSGHGLLVACDAHQQGENHADNKVAADEHKCAAGACGADKKGEHQCGSDKKDEHHCAADKHEKSDAHKCAADKKDEHKCAADKKDEHKCGTQKTDDSKCAAGACGATH
jgi:hypothetical protein